MTDNMGCVQCGAAQESISHVLRDCGFAFAVWLKLLYANQVSDFFEVSFDDWFSANFNGKLRFNLLGDDFGVLFAVVIWLVWKYRNRVVFSNECGQVDDILNVASSMGSNIFQVACRDRGRLDKVAVKEHWQPSDAGWVKINTNGVASLSEDWSAVGGVLRGASGNWLVRFQRFAGRGSTLNAELWAVFHGVEVARLQGPRRVIVESDDRIVFARESYNNCSTN